MPLQIPLMTKATPSIPSLPNYADPKPKAVVPSKLLTHKQRPKKLLSMSPSNNKKTIKVRFY